MLIRSQDKEILINMNNVSQLYTVGFCITADFADNRDSGFRDMGNYSSEEKAIKVLDMIQAAYESSCYCDHAFDSAAQVQRPYIFVRNEVFQMPKDDEVEG